MGAEIEHRRDQPNDDSRSVACGDARHGRDVEAQARSRLAPRIAPDAPSRDPCSRLCPLNTAIWVTSITGSCDHGHHQEEQRTDTRRDEEGVDIRCHFLRLARVAVWTLIAIVAIILSRFSCLAESTATSRRAVPSPLQPLR